MIITSDDIDDVLREVRHLREFGNIEQQAERASTLNGLAPGEIIERATRHFLESCGPTFPTIVRDWSPDRMAKAIRSNVERINQEAIDNRRQVTDVPAAEANPAASQASPSPSDLKAAIESIREQYRLCYPEKWQELCAYIQNTPNLDTLLMHKDDPAQLERNMGMLVDAAIANIITIEGKPRLHHQPIHEIDTEIRKEIHLMSEERKKRATKPTVKGRELSR